MTDRVHQVARKGFAAAPDRYDRGRPQYPPEAVTWMVDRLGIGPGVKVVDLAAGTGKLTRQLAPLGSDLTAVEPVPGMAAVLASHLPHIPIISAPAEDLPFPDSSVDVVTVAQAFHWFDAGPAWRELARVIRRGGGVGLIWNVRDRTVPWVDEMWQVMDRIEKRAPWRQHETDPLRGLDERPGFGPLQEATFHHDVSTTLERLLDRFASVSHVAVLRKRQRQSVLDEVSAIARSHPEAWADGDRLVLRYRTDVYATHRL